MTTTEQDLRYPVGRFHRPPSLTDAEFDAAVASFDAAPARLRRAATGLDATQLDTPYRPDGWTVRQLVHHVADSHLNMFVRLKLALTEDTPTIKPYDQDAWAMLADVRNVPIGTSLQLLDAVHERTGAVLRSLTPADRERMMMHPENGPTRIDQLLALYAWHGVHHTAHIEQLRERMGWAIA
jgi:uncharacterized damage-inducible protein DinB